MAEINEEMRVLIQKERDTYEEETHRAEMETDKVRKSYEGKQKLMKNRLMIAIGSEENLNLEDAVKVACEMLTGIK